MDCTLIETLLGDGRSRYTCPHCPQATILRSGFAHAHRQCKREAPPLGLGDRAERLLQTFGVTQERYVEAKAWLLGKMPEEVTCNCPERIEWLNRIGADIKRLFG